MKKRKIAIAIALLAIISLSFAGGVAVGNEMSTQQGEDQSDIEMVLVEPVFSKEVEKGKYEIIVQICNANDGMQYRTIQEKDYEEPFSVPLLSLVEYW